MSFCSKCGTKLNEGAQFCHSCGAEVISSSSPPSQNQAPASSSPQKEKQPPQKQEKKNKKPAKEGNKVIIFFVLLIIILIGAIFIVATQEETPPSQNMNLSSSPVVERQDSPPSNTPAEKFTPVPTISPSRLTNEKYNFSIDVGNIEIAKINHETDKGTALDTYYYCYKLSPSDPQNEVGDGCGEGNILIFSIDVMTSEQYADIKDYWGTLLAQNEEGLYFVFSHLNGMPPQSLPTGIFEKIEKSFEFGPVG